MSDCFTDPAPVLAVLQTHTAATAVFFLLLPNTLVAAAKMLRACYILPPPPSTRKIIHRRQESWYLICSGACRKEETPSRKPRTGKQAGWEGAGPGQTGIRHGLATRKNLYRQPMSKYLTCFPRLPNQIWQGYNMTMAGKGKALWGGEIPENPGCQVMNSR